MSEAFELLKNTQSTIVSYCVAYRSITGSVTASLLLSQIMYWAAKMEWRPYWKTDDAFKGEIGLTEREMRTAKAALKLVPFIKITREGAPAKTWYQVDPDAWLKVMSRHYATETRVSEKVPQGVDEQETPKKRRAGVPESGAPEAAKTGLSVRTRLDESSKLVPSNRPNILLQEITSVYNSSASALQGGLGLKTAVGKGQASSEFDKATAKQLLDAVVKRLGSSHQFAKAKAGAWAEHIRLMREADKIPEEAIKKAVDWYCLNIGREWVPEAYSTKGFRERYPKIIKQMERRPTVTISTKAREIATDLRDMGWPKGSDVDLETVVQRGLDDYTKLRTAIYNYRPGKTEKDYKSGLERTKLSVARFLINGISDPYTFVKGWMEEVHDQVHRWEDWSGDLASMGLTLQNKRFQKKMAGIAQQYTAQPDIWNEIYQELKESL